MNSQTYSVGRSKISIIFDDITKSKAEVLVSSDDTYLSMGGGVSEAIKNAAGGPWAARVHRLACREAPARVGEVVVTAGDPLPAKYVLHAVALDWEDLFRFKADKLTEDAIARQCTRKVMELLPLLRCHSVALPAIGTGAAGIDLECVASEMAGVLAAMLIDSEEECHVELYLHDPLEGTRHVQFFTQFENNLQRSLGLYASASSSGRVLDLPGATPELARRDPSLDPKRVREAFRMLRHLDLRRAQLEARLVDHVAGDHPLSEPAAVALRSELAKNEAMRRAYEVDITCPPVDPKPTAVFLSSTFEDLKSYRQKVKEKVLELGFQFIGMEQFPSWPQQPSEFIKSMVERAHVYFGILGMRYGFVDSTTGLSMTELEYRKALTHGKPIHMFLMDNGATITPAMVETDPDSYGKLLKLKAEVKDKFVCGFFKDETELGQKVEDTLKAIHRP